MERLIMRFYSSTLITGSLVFLLVGAIDAIALSATSQATLQASATTVQLLTDDSGQPSHRGSGRKEFLELSVLTQQVG